MAEGNESKKFGNGEMLYGREYPGEVIVFPSDMINVSGVEDQPLWVERSEVAAIGMRGPNDTLIVLRHSGTQLVAKGIHPNEVVQLVAGLGIADDQD